MDDARLRELEFLTRLERERAITISHRMPSDPEVRIAIHLLATGLVNDASTVHWDYSQSPYLPVNSRNNYRQKVEQEQWTAIARLHGSQEVRISSTHAAAVRRAELAQSIQRNRLRDPSGILYDSRHADRDLYIALLSASPETPVTVGFLDMNGLKEINDSDGHDAGDSAIRAFFEVVASVIAEKGEAYRIGGDEVLAILTNTSQDKAIDTFKTMMRGISERTASNRPLSASAGITSSAKPGEAQTLVRKRADEIQYRAKQHSKTFAARIGTLAIDGHDEILEFQSSAPARRGGKD